MKELDSKPKKGPSLPKRLKVTAISCKKMCLSNLPNETVIAALHQMRTSEYNPLAQFDSKNAQAPLLNSVWPPNLKSSPSAQSDPTPITAGSNPPKRTATESLDAGAASGKRAKRETE